jgi:hypothetical protein
MTLNKSIRKINKLRDEMISERRRKTVSPWHNPSKFQAATDKVELHELKRRNLIELTENIRQEGQQIELLSRYSDLLREREFKEFLTEEDKKPLTH